MKYLRDSTLIATLLLSLGCPKAKLTQRYESMTRQRVPKHEQLVFVSGFTLAESEDASLSGLSKLSDRGQAALISELGRNSRSADELLSLVSGSLSAKSSAAHVIDKTLVKKRVVFSVEKNGECGPCRGGRLSLADRIHSLKVVLTFADESESKSATRFHSWDRFSTEYQTVDLGDVTLDQTSGASLTLYGPQGYSNIGGGSQRERTEEVSLSQRYVALSGRLSANEAHLYLEGVTGIDLAGNFSVDFVLALPAGDLVSSVRPGGLWKQGAPTPADKVSLSIQHWKLPASSKERRAGFSISYSLRHVEKGEATIGEDDDRVLLLSGENSLSDLQLLSPKELEAVFYGVGYHDPNGNKGGELSLSGPETLPLYFSDLSTAHDFLAWLKQTESNALGVYKLLLNQKPILAEQIPHLSIERVHLN